MERLSFFDQGALRISPGFPIRMPGGIFNVARYFMRGAPGLVDLAFDLKAGFSSEAAGGVLHGAFGFISGALDMFLVHVFLLWFHCDNSVERCRVPHKNSVGV